MMLRQGVGPFPHYSPTSTWPRVAAQTRDVAWPLGVTDPAAGPLTHTWPLLAGTHDGHRWHHQLLTLGRSSLTPIYSFASLDCVYVLLLLFLYYLFASLCYILGFLVFPFISEVVSGVLCNDGLVVISG